MVVKKRKRSLRCRGEAPPESAWSRLHQRPESLHESEIILWLWADGAVDRGVEKELGCAHLTHHSDIFLDLLQGPTEDRATGAEWLGREAKVGAHDHFQPPRVAARRLRRLAHPRRHRRHRLHRQPHWVPSVGVFTDPFEARRDRPWPG